MLTVEPGRAIAAQAGVALYKTGSFKEVGERRFVAVDGGMADNIRPTLYGARYEALSAGKADTRETEPVTIVGRYCESGDVLVNEAMLAPVAAGDIIALPVCGAYCIPMASNYNAALKPAIVMVANGESRIIRRRETLQDLTRNDIF
jgi:diaminopimelate decarboxylase